MRRGEESIAMHSRGAALKGTAGGLVLSRIDQPRWYNPNNFPHAPGGILRLKCSFKNRPSRFLNRSMFGILDEAPLSPQEIPPSRDHFLS